MPGKATCSFDLPTVWVGQHEDVEFLRDERHRPGEIALVDDGVDADGQVRAVLLDRRGRQHRDGAAHVAAAEFLGGQSRSRSGRASRLLADGMGLETRGSLGLGCNDLHLDLEFRPGEA